MGWNWDSLLIQDDMGKLASRLAIVLVNVSSWGNVSRPYPYSEIAVAWVHFLFVVTEICHVRRSGMVVQNWWTRQSVVFGPIESVDCINQKASWMDRDYLWKRFRHLLASALPTAALSKDFVQVLCNTSVMDRQTMFCALMISSPDAIIWLEANWLVTDDAPLKWSKDTGRFYRLDRGTIWLLTNFSALGSLVCNSLWLTWINRDHILDSTAADSYFALLIIVPCLTGFSF